MRISSHKAILVAAAFSLGSGLGSGSTIADPAGKPGGGSVSLHGLDLERSTIPEIQDAMDHGRFSAFELTAFYLERIAQVDPKVHAVITTSPTALIEALVSDIRRQTHR